jgi:hypothetical protein
MKLHTFTLFLISFIASSCKLHQGQRYQFSAKRKAFRINSIRSQQYLTDEFSNSVKRSAVFGFLYPEQLEFFISEHDLVEIYTKNKTERDALFPINSCL